MISSYCNIIYNNRSTVAVFKTDYRQRVIWELFFREALCKNGSRLQNKNLIKLKHQQGLEVNLVLPEGGGWRQGSLAVWGETFSVIGNFTIF